MLPGFQGVLMLEGKAASCSPSDFLQWRPWGWNPSACGVSATPLVWSSSRRNGRWSAWLRSAFSLPLGELSPGAVVSLCFSPSSSRNNDFRASFSLSSGVSGAGPGFSGMKRSLRFHSREYCSLRSLRCCAASLALKLAPSISPFMLAWSTSPFMLASSTSPFMLASSCLHCPISFLSFLFSSCTTKPSSPLSARASNLLCNDALIVWSKRITVMVCWFRPWPCCRPNVRVCCRPNVRVRDRISVVFSLGCSRPHVTVNTLLSF